MFYRLFEFKGKGILLIPIVVGVQIGVAIVLETVHQNIPFLARYPLPTLLFPGIGFILSGVWIWAIKDTYYYNKEGEKIIVEEEENSFFFIRLAYWSRILYLAGICCLVEVFLGEINF